MYIPPKFSLLPASCLLAFALTIGACSSGVEVGSEDNTSTLPFVEDQPTSTTPPTSADRSDTTVEAVESTTTSSTSTSTTVEVSLEVVPLRFESAVDDVSVAELEQTALAVLNDERGWVKAGFEFVADPASQYRVVLAEGAEVDRLCLPLSTGGRVSCQNGPVVALNADRWRSAVPHWDAEVEDYRGYLVNHEVGHLIGQRHPQPRCPVQGQPAGVMEQQTGSLQGCIGNAWPRDWEIELAKFRPVVYAPLPDWAPDPVPVNGER